MGTQIGTGPGTFGLAVNPRGVVATTDIGPARFGITTMEKTKSSWEVRHIWARTPRSKAPEAAEPGWRSVGKGIAFENDRHLWISEGASAKLRLLDITSSIRQKLVDLNDAEWHASISGDLAFDALHRFLYVIDEANSRVVVVDASKGRVVSSVRMEGRLGAITSSPDSKTMFVTSDTGNVCAVDVSAPARAALKDCIRTGDPQGIIATADRIFVSNGRADSVSVISVANWRVVAQIPLRIPGLESYRGIRPAGLAYDPLTKWLLVAETGINAVGIVDTTKSAVIAHIPTGWEPSRVLINGDRVYISNLRGQGAGPNIRRPLLELGESPTLSGGTVSTFIMPSASELPKLTGTVFAANGFFKDEKASLAYPAAIRNVVVIAKSGRTFDDVFGDITEAANGAVAGNPRLAIFGSRGIADGQGKRFSVQDVPVTPNQHAVARRWVLGDNFYSDGNLNEGVTEYLASRGVSSRAWTKGTDFASDQTRADRFISDLKAYESTRTLPQYLYLELPNDGYGAARPDDGYPYEASLVADNDFATGRVIESLSRSPWWRTMVVFITEDNADSGLDHIDSHRTLLMAAGPWCRQNFAAHTNSNPAGLRKTIFGLLGVPPASLGDATAASLSNIFSAEPNFEPFTALPADSRIFQPGQKLP